MASETIKTMMALGNVSIREEEDPKEDPKKKENPFEKKGFVFMFCFALEFVVQF